MVLSFWAAGNRTSHHTRQTVTQSALLLAAACLSLLCLSACRSDRVSIDLKDPNAPQFAYRKDELALLQMAADDIQELERHKRYGAIYDDYTSDNFKKGVGRRQFMIMSNCVESFLGDVEEYDRNDIGFRREFLKDKSGQTAQAQQKFVDVLNRKVQRALGSVEEQLVFVPNGLSFELNGLYWIAKDKSFLQCMAQSGQLDADTSPKPEVTEETAPGEEKATTPKETQSNDKAPATDGTPTALTAPNQAASNDNSQSTKATDSKAPATVPVPSGGANSLEIKPVQAMKPAEIKKAPLKARPAGAGAVVDQRPVVPKSGEEKKAEEEAKKRRLELQEDSNSQGTVPLPTNPGSDD